MKYFFILGRNPDLSRAEILSYLEARNKKSEQILFTKNYLILDTDLEQINIQDFGGCIMMGKIQFQGTLTDFNNYVDGEDLVQADKFTYAIHGNMDEEILIKKFKYEHRKAVIRHGRRNINMQDGGIVSIPNAEFNFFMLETTEVFYGLVEQDYSFTEIKERDMKKPVRRESLAISPRLAKILINLSQAKPGELLLDPFCGVGGILQEALVRGINVYGIDKDKLAIEDARKNLKWLEQNFEVKGAWNLAVADARKTPNIKFDAVATEPALGELLRHRPDKRKTKEILTGFETLISGVLQRLQELKKFSAKIVLTCPHIGDKSIDMNYILQRTNLKVHEIPGVTYPLREFREDQFVSRDIWILE